MTILGNKTKYIWMAMGLFATFSCEDFLDKNPLDSVSSEIFWQSEDDALIGLAGVYYRLQENFMGYERVYMDGLTDNAFADAGNGNQSNLASMTTGSISPSLGGAMGNMYSTPYRIISAANHFLDNIDRAPLDEETNTTYKAEVRFLRALAYFDLVQAFGDVIIYRNYLKTLDEALIAKSSTADVYAFIEDDLDFAISNLPDTRYAGHAVKSSAQALMARVLMTQNKWSEALPHLEAVMTGGLYALSDDYSALFTTEGQDDGEMSKEIIFATQYLSPNIHRSGAGIDIELGLWSLLQPYQDLADDYHMTDGLPASESPLLDTADIYANRDPRLDYTLKLPGEIWYGPDSTAFNGSIASATGFIAQKYVDLTRVPISRQTDIQSDQDYIHLRYADVLLMYAEVKNEVSGPDASVYDAINQVRSRASVAMPDVDEDRYSTQELLREYIRHERRVEFALEGQRYNDLKRWQIAHVKLPTLTTPNGSPLVFEQKHYTLPFSQTELDRNPQLRQNENYN